MKTMKVIKTVSLLLIILIAISCRNSRSTTGRQYPRNIPAETPTKTTTVYTDGGNLPPGQAKKVYGDKSAKAYAPGQGKKSVTRYPLVIVYTPGIVIKRHSDGRYYYINTVGHTYWKGNDGRYYIDEKHLKGMNYEANEYDDWKMKGQKDSKVQETKDKKDEGKKEKEDLETKDAAKVKHQKEKDQDKKTKDNDQKEKPQTASTGNDEKSQKGNGKSKGKG